MKKNGWLLFFYSIPSKPVSNRMRIWRRLIQSGALPFKGACYILPYSEEHHEFCQWLVSEVIGMDGEAAFVQVKKIETMNDEEIIDLFNRYREQDYKDVEKEVEDLERRIESLKKGSRISYKKQLSEQFNKILQRYDAINKIDFFSSKMGTILKERIKTLQSQIKNIDRIYVTGQIIPVASRQIKDYQGKIWVTRKRPYVDRMASAWLIRRFIDPKASFMFIDEKDVFPLNKDMVTFDILNGEFTHQGDMCTFEVLMKSFNISDKAVKRIAEIVHELDIKDEKFRSDEAKGIEEILKGIRKTSRDDKDALEKGILIFEMLYQSKS